ncbi:MAG: hypothetical protein KC766_29395 [Myxococcales bacterium]|nr:hypothetical protein [Myxococcales bacterium]
MKPVTDLELLRVDDTLLLRTPERAFSRRGLLDAGLSPLVGAVLIPALLTIGDPDDPLVWVLLAVIAFAVLGSTLNGVYFLTFARRLSERSTWAFRVDQGGAVSVSGRGGALALQVPHGSEAVAVTAWLPATFKLVLRDPMGRTICVLSSRVLESRREDWSRALAAINQFLRGGLQATSIRQPSPSSSEPTPGERSLAMLCYLPVQGIFVFTSVACLVVSRSDYVRSAAKQSLLQFGFSLLVLGLILLLFGLPTALLSDPGATAPLAAALTISTLAFAAWNLSAHVYACVRFYRGRPWIMPWLRPVARRWFEVAHTD